MLMDEARGGMLRAPGCHDDDLSAARLLLEGLRANLLVTQLHVDVRRYLGEQ